MKTTCFLLAVLSLTIASADDELYKGVKVKTLAKKEDAKKTPEVVPSNKKTPQPVAQERQDSYGAPQAPSVDSYGSPQAPVQDSYGSPQAAPVAAAPVQGEVGTQGYYYYYYPVANSYSPTQNYQSNKNSASSGSSSGGLLGGSNLGLLIFLGLGALVVFALIAATFSNSSSRRSFSDLTNGYSFDTDELMYQVYNAIELYQRWSA